MPCYTRQHVTRLRSLRQDDGNIVLTSIDINLLINLIDIDGSGFSFVVLIISLTNNGFTDFLLLLDSVLNL